MPFNLILEHFYFALKYSAFQVYANNDDGRAFLNENFLLGVGSINFPVVSFNTRNMIEQNSTTENLAIKRNIFEQNSTSENLRTKR